jgi:hypothetical protein
MSELPEQRPRLGILDTTDPPPLKWSDLRYVFDIQEDCNGEDTASCLRLPAALGFGRHQLVSLSRPRDTMRFCSDHRATGWHGQNNRAALRCISLDRERQRNLHQRSALRADQDLVSGRCERKVLLAPVRRATASHLLSGRPCPAGSGAISLGFGFELRSPVAKRLERKPLRRWPS